MRASSLVAAAVAASVVLFPAFARSQTSTGGTSGTGALAAADIFLGVQKVKGGVNLNDVDRARFLNGASCSCKRKTWIKAVLNANAIAKSTSVPSTYVASMYLGLGCDNSTFTSSCRLLATSPSFLDFRQNGMLVETSVDVLAGQYGSVVTNTSTGGTTGAGGAGGAGGTDGTGGTTVTTDPSDRCSQSGQAYTQTLWLFVGSSVGRSETLVKNMALVIDAAPPPTPVVTSLAPANEALIVNWTAIDKALTVDLAGYQVFCTRADQYNVFGPGAFTTTIDSACGDEPTDESPTALADLNTNFLCSGFLGVSDTSARIKVLQNGIPYGIGVAAVDTHGNASPIVAQYQKPVQTLDFYHQYRTGDPQGEATGGCSIGGDALPGVAGVGLGVVVVGLALASSRRRRGERRP